MARHEAEAPVTKGSGPWKAIQWVAGLVFAACLVALGVFAFQYLWQSHAYSDLEGNVEVSGDTLADLTVDWDALRATNPDVVAWVYMPGTPINYPVVQGSDNETYLHTAFDRSTGFLASKGCIFSDATGARDLSERNVVLYGHHMRDGSMFASLDDLREQAAFDEHRDLFVLTPQGNYRLRTFAFVVTTGTDHIVQTRFATDAAFQDYIRDKMARSVVSQSDFSAYDIRKTFTLSTCEYTLANGRAVVFAAVVESTVGSDPYVPVTKEPTTLAPGLVEGLGASD